MKKLAELLATFFYVGCFPVAPGSLGTLAGLGLCVVLEEARVIYVLTFLVLTVLGVWSAEVVEQDCQQKDPGCVVIDEVAGIMVTFFLIPLSVPVLCVGYFLFRAFDMFKVYPANRIEAAGGGIGIMADDLIAGLYANLVLQTALFLNKIL